MKTGEKKKVLFVATVDSHIELFHLPYLKMFKDKNYEVHVATNTDKPIKYCDSKIKLPIRRSPFRLSNLKAIRELKKIINAEKYDIIHCHTPMGGVVARLAAKKARKTGTRVIYTAHGFHFYKGAPLKNWLLFYPVEKHLAKYTDTLITINDEDFERAKKKFEKRCHDIEYVPGVGVDEKKFNKKLTKKQYAALRKSLKLKDDDFVMIYAAELSKRKNQIWLIKTVADILKEHKDWHILLVGGDNMKKKCQKLVKRLKLEKQIHILGFRNDVADLMKISNVALSTSKQEGLPVNLIEAACVGLPIIATDCRGNRDVVKNARGFLISQGDKKDFQNKIDDTRYSINPYSKKSCKQAFLLSYVANNMEQIYSNKLYKYDMEKGLISVCMGVYNCESYVAESLDSILNQTIKNVEIIVCDDCSTDSTYEILKKYEKKYHKKIRVLKNDINMGLNATLNKCLYYSKGEYIARQDGDDISLPERFEKEYLFLKNHNEYGFVSSNMTCFDKNGDHGIVKHPTIPANHDFAKESPFCHAPVMVRRNVLESVGNYTVGKKLLRVEDYHLWFKLYSRGIKGYNIDSPLYKMRDDLKAAKRRTVRNRINESYVKWVGFRMIKMPLLDYVYILRPLLLIFVPRRFYLLMHRTKLGRKYNESV